MLFAALNELLTVFPRLETVVTMAITIKASITAYSAAVGPSSLAKKRLIFEIAAFIVASLSTKRWKPGRVYHGLLKLRSQMRALS
jgi:hypothetical protein